MKKLGKRNNGMMDSMVVARGCYCGSLCTCHNTPNISGTYTSVEAAGWMVMELIS